MGGDAARPKPLERLLAAAALAATFAALATFVAGVLSSWVAALLVALGLLIVVAALWDFLARRGAGRTLALVVALVGSAVVVVGVVAADLSLLRVAVAVACFALAMALARAALRREVIARLAASTSPVPAAARPALILNPRSGGGKAERFRLVDECAARGIEPIVLEPGDDLVQLAEDAIARGADAIGMAGGDGSQALVADVAIRHGVPLVVVPAGTRNHFALDLGVDRDDVVGALDAFGPAVSRRVDVADVDGRVFVNNVSLGVYAKIVASPEYRDAKRETTVDTLPELLGPGAEPLDLRFTTPDGIEQPTAHLIMVSNGPYQLHRLVTGRFRRGRLDVGELAIVAARFTNAREASRFLAMEATGRSRRFPGWHEWTAPRFRVDSAAPIEIGIDGEALTLEPPLEFASRPGALEVRLPPQAISGRAAGARVHVLAHATLTDLARVAAGRPVPV